MNSWAAVIGINSYAHLSRPLTYAVADAEGVAGLLVTRLDLPRENVFVILDPLHPRLPILPNIRWQRHKGRSRGASSHVLAREGTGR